MTNPRWLRPCLYAFLILLGIGVWMPYLAPAVSNWREAYRLRHTPAILYTTDTRGILDTCGCSAGGSGGLVYRHSVLADQRGKRRWLLLVDNGNLTDNPDKLPVTLQAMAMMQYDAVGAGALDEKAAASYALAARRYHTPLVRAFPRGDVLDPLCKPLRIKRLHGHTLGVTALPPLHPGEDAAAYLEKATATLRSLRRQCDFLVVLSQLGLARDKDLARRCGKEGPQVLIGNLDARKLTEPLQIGATTLLPAGNGGIYLGTADVRFPLGRAPQIGRTDLLIVKEDAPPAPDVQDIVSRYYRKVEAAFARRTDPRLLQLKTAGAAGDVIRCGGCHPHEARSWRRTRHHNAVDTIINKRRMSPDCIRCHSVRFTKTGIFDLAARAGGVDCTSCHAPAGAGDATNCPDRATRTRGEATCIPCHTTANSPRFRYLTYLPQIDHSDK